MTSFVKARTCLLCCLWFAGLFVGAVAAKGAFREWVAHNSDSGNLSEPGNWRPAGVPQNGDDLLFEVTAENSFPQQNMVNDLVDLRLRKIEFCSDGWSLVGNELTIGEYVGPRRTETNLCAFRSFRFDCPLKLGGATTMDTGYSSTLILKGYIDLNGYDLLLSSRDRMIVSSEIRGMGNVIASVDSFAGHNSQITFDGPTGNTFSGKLIIRQLFRNTSVVVFDKEFGLVVSDALLIGERPSFNSDATRATCKLARSHQIGDNAEVCLTGGSQFLLDGHTETIGSLCLTNNSGDTEPTLVDTGGATLSVQGDITAVNDAAGVIPTMLGKIGLPGPAASGPQKSLRKASALTVPFVAGNQSR